MAEQKRSIKDVIIHDWASSRKRTLGNFVLYTTIGVLIAYFVFGAPREWNLLIGACIPTSLMIAYAHYLKFSRLRHGKA